MGMIDYHYMSTKPDNYLASQPRMSTRLAQSLIELHGDKYSYDDFAENYPEACHSDNTKIWIDTRILMRYLEYRGV